MNFRTTLVIIVLLAVFAAAYFLFFQEPTDETAANEKPPIYQVYGIERNSIEQIELSFADAAYHDLKLAKDANNNWQLEAPFLARANNEKMNQMLDDVLNKRVKQTLEVSELTQYGLDTPNITLSLWTEGTAPKATFLIGKKAINYSVYIKEESEAHIFLIESSALDDLTKSPTDIRDRSVVKFNAETVSNIQFKHGDIGSKPSPVICEKQGDTWQITDPIKVKADAQEIEQMLSELLLLQVSTFEADGADATVVSQLEKFGLDTPRVQVKLTDRDSTYVLAIGSAAPSEDGRQERVYVKVSAYHESIHTVSDDIYRLLNKSAFDLRDKRVIDFQRISTNRFVISINGQQDAVCTKGFDNIWKLQTPTGKIKADAKAVDDLLFGIDSLEAVAFVESPVKNLGLYGLAPPSIKVTFTQQGEEKPAIMLIGDSAEDDTVYVKAEDSSQVVRVERTLIDKVALGAAWLRDKQVLNFHIDEAIRLTLRGEDIESLTCQRLGTNWRLTSPVKEAANNAEVNAIIYELDNLMAATFIRDDAVPMDSTTGFNNPHLQLTIELRDKKVFTLQIGKTDASGRFYARLQHEPDAIFLLNAELVPKLKTTLTLLRTPKQGFP